MKSNTKLLYTFGVISDLHIGEKSIYVDNFKTAIKSLEKLNVEFITISGDITRKGQANREDIDYSNNDANCDGRSEDLDVLMKAVDDCNITISMYMCGGNHDVTQKNSKWHTTVDELGRNKLNKKNIDICNDNEKTYSALIHNDLFIFISFDRGYGDNTYIESIPWAIKKIEENEDKRIFIFIHYPLMDGVAGEFENEYFGFSKNAKDNKKLLDIITKHKNIIVFSGHTHHPYELAKSDIRKEKANFYLLDDSKSTALVSAGVISYSINETTAIEPWITTPDYAPEGLIVKVYDNQVVIEPIRLKEIKYLGEKYIVNSLISNNEKKT